LRDTLSKYLPEESVDPVVDLIRDQDLHFRISKPRKTKLGDYRSPQRKGPHKISVNGDLNKYSFLITFLHEYAHLLTYSSYKRRVDPHGPEWKSAFGKLLSRFLSMNIFPDDIAVELHALIDDPSAGHYSNAKLAEVLHRYDNTEHTLLQDLEEGTPFTISGKRAFVKGELARSRYRCRSLDNNKMYFVHKLAPVQIIDQNN